MTALALTLVVSLFAGPPSLAAEQCDQSPFAGLRQNVGVPSSKLAEHLALRAKGGWRMPKAKSRIAIFQSGKHYTSSAFSLVATRNGAGLWILDDVSESGPGLLPNPVVRKHFVEPMTAEESRSVDALLGDKCLYREPVSLHNFNIVSGGATATVEINIPGHRRLMTAFGGVKGVNGRLVDILFAAARRGAQRDVSRLAR